MRRLRLSSWTLPLQRTWPSGPGGGEEAARRVTVFNMGVAWDLARGLKRRGKIGALKFVAEPVLGELLWRSFVLSVFWIPSWSTRG